VAASGAQRVSPPETARDGEPPELASTIETTRTAQELRRAPKLTLHRFRSSHAAGAPQGPRPCWMRTSRTRQAPAASQVRSCFRPRALSPARVRGPCLPLHSSPRGRAASSAPTSLVHLKPGHLRDFIVCSCPSSYLAGPGEASRPTFGGSDHCVCSGSVTAALCPDTAVATASTSGPASKTPVTRRARPKARRRSASARQAGSGCRCAPRPDRLRAGSGTALN
jgi:hypothetical protein